MKPLMFNWQMLFLLLTVPTACKEEECPADQYLGRAFLMQESIDLIVEPPAERIIFTNKDQAETIFWDYGFSFYSDVHVIDRRIGYLCQRKESTSYYRMDVQRISGTYQQFARTNEHSLYFLYNLSITNKNDTNPEDTLLVDEFTIGSQPSDRHLVTGVKPPSLLTVITSNRNNPGPFPQEYYFHEKITLRGKEFRNVYENYNSELKLYFSFEFGVVAYEDLEKELWVLDRYE